MSDVDDLERFLNTDAQGVPVRGSIADPVPHVVTVLAYDEDDDDLECEVAHPDTCQKVERWEGVWDYDCQVAWEISEGGGVLAALRTSGDLGNEEGLKPGTYPIEGWTTVYPATPDHATEYDAGIRLIQEKP